MREGFPWAASRYTKTAVRKTSQSYLLLFATATLVLVLEMPQQIRTIVAVDVNQASVTLRDEAFLFSLR